VTYGDFALSLTPKEYGLLELFLRKQSQVFSRAAILDSLWNCGEAPGEDTVTAHIKGLRRKLMEAGGPADLIKTVYGVGYRLNPEEPAPASPDHCPPAAPTRPSPAAMPGGVGATRQQQTRAALRSLWPQVKPQHEERLALVKQAVEALAIGQLTDSLHDQACRAAHGLKGALGVFGLTQGSDIAQLILQRLTDDSAAMDSPSIAQLWAWVLALEQELAQGPSPPRGLAAQAAISLLVIIDNPPQLTHDLAAAAMEKGLAVDGLADFEHLQTWRHQITGAYRDDFSGAMGEGPKKGLTSLPDLGLLNYSLSQAGEADLTRFAALIDQLPPLPVMVCSTDGSLQNRIKAARLGDPTFLHNPDISQILRRGALLRSSVTVKVLLVDDDPHVLSALRVLLEPWGIQLTTLEGSLNFWHTLQTIDPDLVVLDIAMPEFNGLDLCRVVRQTPTWHHLPIVFFTAHGDATHKHAAMMAGANDLIEKSLTDADLIKRLFCQIRRTRLQHPMAVNPQGHLDPAIP